MLSPPNLSVQGVVTPVCPRVPGLGTGSGRGLSPRVTVCPTRGWAVCGLCWGAPGNCSCNGQSRAELSWSGTN